jgi:hypothetical protein
MASVGRMLSHGCLLRHSLIYSPIVGAMFYLSPQLTILMLGVVPPVSLGAVRIISSFITFVPINVTLGILWSLFEKTFK